MWLFSVIFFFFKQKTAYEMRISDWSSDVCSSDFDKNMAAYKKADDLSAFLLMLKLLALTELAFTVRSFALTAYLLSFYFAAGVSAAAFQIGRASCRERVCQYV